MPCARIRSVLIALLVLATIGPCTTNAQSAPPTTVVGARLQDRASALLTQMGFALTPDVTTGSISISDPGSGNPRIQSTSLGGGFTASSSFPLYLEGTVAYSRYDPRFLVTDGQDVREVPTRWNSLSATVGIGWDFPIMQNLTLRPMLNGSYGRVTSDAVIAGRLIESNTDKQLEFLANGHMDAAGGGGSIVLDYERYRPEGEVDVELRYTSIFLRSVGSTSAGVYGSSVARSLNLWSRYRAPLGVNVLDRPLRYVLEYARTSFYGDLDGALGFSYLNSVGLGIELDTSKYGHFISRWRLVARYRFGGNVSGASIGLAISF